VCFTIFGLMITITRAPAADWSGYVPRQKTAQELRDEAWQKAILITAIGDFRNFY
jgi:hypothetical protein